jgi:regulator of replication initiation timing
MKEKMIYMTESEFKQLMRESLRDAGIDKIVLENEFLKVENAQLKKQLESK